MRTSSLVRVRVAWPLVAAPGVTGPPSEIALALTVLHRGLGDAVIGAGLAALGDPGGGDLADHLFEGAGVRTHGAGAGHVADRAVANRGRERVLAVHELDVGAHRVEHPVAGEHLALVGEVDGGDLEALLRDVLPHVELGPVRKGEHTDVFPGADAAVIERPQLWALALGVPLAEIVAKGEDPLLGPRALLVAAGATEGGVEAVLLDGIQQGGRLQPVARGARTLLLDDTTAIDRVLDAGHDQPLPELVDEAVTELD